MKTFVLMPGLGKIRNINTPFKKLNAHIDVSKYYSVKT